MKTGEGLPNPRGARWDGNGTNFALFSGNATKVGLSIRDFHLFAFGEIYEVGGQLFLLFLEGAKPAT